MSPALNRLLLLTALMAYAVNARADAPYPWRPADQPAADTLERRLPPPPGFTRVPAAAGSFSNWLRGLPLLPASAPVMLHTGRPKWRQDVHAAVVDIDIGAKDLQQCADAVMRLRAEYLRANGRSAAIAFNDTGAGQPMSYTRFANGERPRAEGRGLIWSVRAAPDQSYAGFRRYMDTVFVWAGTYSLERELVSVSTTDIQVGDVFIKGGFPGHAVLVVDVAVNAGTGEKRILLAQSFMPAQNIHVLKSAADPSTPWTPVPPQNQAFATPEWIFPAASLKRWR
jgi:Domain of unknown function (4846)